MFFRQYRVLLAVLLAADCALTATALARESRDWMQSAMQAAEEGRFGVAERRYRQVLRQEPQHPQAMYGLAVALNSMGRTEEATRLLEELITVQPKFQPAYYLLGTLYERQGDLKRAREAYRTYVAISPASIPPDPDIRIKLRSLGIF
ncbi:MAG TPA: tetratricopeptide repeat protein [Oculatellaceae cyanobacterium]|jgi:protein O-GlcNAc transferase